MALGSSARGGHRVAGVRRSAAMRNEWRSGQFRGLPQGCRTWEQVTTMTWTLSGSEPPSQPQKWCRNFSDAAYSVSTAFMVPEFPASESSICVASRLRLRRGVPRWVLGRLLVGVHPAASRCHGSLASAWTARTGPRQQSSEHNRKCLRGAAPGSSRHPPVGWCPPTPGASLASWPRKSAVSA